MIAELMMNTPSTSMYNNKKARKLSTVSHSGNESIPSFIRKTYDILEENKYPEIISWNPEGTSLVIKKPQDFCQDVLPLYFKHNNLTSFIRQLNMYNFHKRRTQNTDHIYAHELFQRGRRYLLKDIKRKTNNDKLDNNSVNSPVSEEANTTNNIQSFKLPETFYTTPSGQDRDALMYENQFLKKLYNEVMSKLMVLESQTEQLTAQNKDLMAQLHQNNSQPKLNNPFVLKAEQCKEEAVNNNDNLVIPSLKLEFLKNTNTNTNDNLNSLSLVKLNSKKENSRLNLDEPTEFTESPFTAPSTQINEDREHSLKTELLGNQGGMNFNFTLGIQKLRSDNDLRISKENMSIGHLLEAWNVNVHADNNNNNSLLGKREASMNLMGFDDLGLKRRELSIFGKRGLLSEISNGVPAGANEDFDMDLFTFIN